jgi:hypothetical protein
LVTPRSFLLVVLTAFPALAAGAVGVVHAPKIQRPQPVPTTPMPALPPAIIDDKLAIGGEDINARKSNTRMTVEVRVNGRGPYRFLVDSGADTSVVGSGSLATCRCRWAMRSRCTR